MCASGLIKPETNVNNAAKVAELALRLSMERFELEYALDEGGHRRVPVVFRFGIHAGELICGVLARARFNYDVMGETVNLAARMEQMSEPGRILCSEYVATLLVPEGFVFSDHGVVNVKGKGPMRTFFLDSSRGG